VTFFEVNLDYVYFLAGLSLMSLGAVATLLSIERERTLKWPWLAGFGVFASLSLWAASATVIMGDAPFFAWLRLLMVVSAMAALFEFGRASLGMSLRRVPGPGLTLALAAAVLATAAFGLDHAAIAVRHGLGIPGAVLAVWALLLGARRPRGAERGIATRSRHVLVGAGLGFAVYALCLAGGGGVVVGTRSAATWLGPVPVQAIAAVAIFLAAVELLGYSAAQQVLRGQLTSMHQAFGRFYGVAVMLVVVVAGAFAVNQAATIAETAAEATLSRRALTAAAALGTEDASALNGTSADTETEVYRQLVSEIQHMHTANPDVLFLYLMARKNGRDVILAHSGPGGSSDVAPPGTIYGDASPKLDALLEGRGTAFVEGPRTDSRGVWVSAFAPVYNLGGRVVGVMGMDVSGDTWTMAMSDYRAMSISLVLVLSVMALGAMATVQIAQDTRHRVASSESRLRSILAGAPDGIAILEPTSRRIEFANPTLASMLGVRVEDLMGVRLETLIAGGMAKDDPPMFRDDATTEMRMLTGSGVALDAEVASVPIVVDDADRLLVYVHDVTERRAAEGELRERMALENVVRAVSSRFLSSDAADVDTVVLEALATLGTLLDVDRVYLGSVTPDGLATRAHEWCSPGTPSQAQTARAIDLRGFPWFYGKLKANEFAAVSSLDELPDDATADRAIMASQGVRSRVVIPLMEGELLTGYLGIDAVREEHAWSGERVALLTVFADVLSAALHRSRVQAEVAKLTLAVTNSPAATVITDADGAIEYVNPRFQELSGYSAEELMGGNPRVLKSGEMEPEVYEELWRVITAGGDWRGEFVNKRKDGTHYAVAASISPVRDAKGAVHYVGVQEDITALKVAEDSLRDAADEANAANRAKSDFLATMSHEIRTPMNAIIGMGELLEETELTDEQHRYIRIFRSAGEALLTLINDILDLSKIEAGQFEIDPRPFEVEQMVEETAEVIAIRAREKGLELLVDIDPVTPRCIVGDPDRLRQVLVNLTGNAVKFTGTGHVLISVGPDLAGADPTLRFTVADTGIGIATEKLDTIFEAFTQADSSTTRRYGGTGLGLTISRKLTSLMGGSLRVASVEGEGSSFSFSIPLVEAEPESSPEAGSEHARLEGVHALVIDDSETNRLILQRYLEHAGAEISEAAGGEEGLAALRASSQRFDVVLTDLRMPGLSGFDVAASMIDDPSLTGVPVLVISSDARPGDEQRAHEAGAWGLLVKPVRRRTLLDAVASACRPAVRSAEPLVGSRSPSVSAAGPSVDNLTEAMDILLVEDTEDNRLLALAYLKSTPHRVVTANNGVEAVEAYKTAGAGGFDMVLMDMQMPVMDGYAATREIREIERAARWAHTKIIALTAYALAQETTAAMDAGCDDYLTKPIKKATLLDAVARHSGA
jgi:two-component system sensor histidine kinase/response regulator